MLAEAPWRRWDAFLSVLLTMIEADRPGRDGSVISQFSSVQLKHAPIVPMESSFRGSSLLDFAPFRDLGNFRLAQDRGFSILKGEAALIKFYHNGPAFQVGGFLNPTCNSAAPVHASGLGRARKFSPHRKDRNICLSEKMVPDPRILHEPRSDRAAEFGTVHSHHVFTLPALYGWEP